MNAEINATQQQLIHQAHLMVDACKNRMSRIQSLRERPRRRYWLKMKNRGIAAKKVLRLEARLEAAANALVHAEAWAEHLTKLQAIVPG